MEDRTQEFLKECKDAGYERITIFIADKRVPLSARLKKESKAKGSDATYWGNTYNTPFKVVCGCPERISGHPTLPGNQWPLLWGIVRNLGLNPRGGGSGDSHDIEIAHLEDLKAGYYDLA